LSFQQIPSFEIFMKDGRLQAVYEPVTILFNVVALLLTISVPVWFPSYRISRMGLPEALNGGDK
jgi:ABC-type lipoprotein release transport system permease subunit